MFRNKLVKVIKAKMQIDSGLKYELTMELGISDCLKSDKMKDLVKDYNINEVQECIVQIWIQPWLQKQKMTDFSCQPIKKV